ncbi:MAG: sodium:proton antiporter [Phycisphaeraceae bacterium]
MTIIVAFCVATIFGTGLYMILGRELKGIAMGLFLLAHAANLSIIAMSGSPITADGIKAPPVIGHDVAPADALASTVDPLPQALILTAIVIGFGVMGFLLSLIVVTGRTSHTLNIAELARHERQSPFPEPEEGKPRVNAHEHE